MNRPPIPWLELCVAGLALWVLIIAGVQQLVLVLQIMEIWP
ncbi:hypothetical protein [Neoroseomonas terrae]|nr:hypothetical protein [Neoroseomonas terrae]